MKTLFPFLVALCLLVAPRGQCAENLAIAGDTIHTMDGAALKNGVVLIRDGRIETIGPAASVKIPDGYRLLQAAVVTPGLIDAHSTVGLSGILNQPTDQDQLEKSGAFQPELRAIDAYNARDPLIAYVRSFGVTTVNTGHAPGALASGQTMIVKTLGRDADQDVVNPAAMTAVALGSNGLNQADGGAKGPGTRSKAVAMLRSELIRTREYAGKRSTADESKRPGRDLKYETLLRALAGTQPLLVNANRQQDILSAIRVAREFGVHIVLDGCADAPLVLGEIKASGFPVILHPTMARSNGDAENLTFEAAARLRAAGIPFALQTGFESYVPKTRVILLEAAVAAANGLGFDAALASITIESAKILGISDRTGSLAAGKDADLALFDGDPFEYTSHCTAAVINGQVFASGPR